MACVNGRMTRYIQREDGRDLSADLAHAIQRAMTAEAEVERLQALLTDWQLSALLSDRAFYSVQEAYLAEKAKVERLNAALEALEDQRKGDEGNIE